MEEIEVFCENGHPNKVVVHTLFVGKDERGDFLYDASFSPDNCKTCEVSMYDAVKEYIKRNLGAMFN